MNAQFDRARAFSRTLGWLTQEELDLLGRKTVAIAGLGGVGGIHCETLTRLGIGGFKIADFDRYAIENFNRQSGAAMSTIDRPKLEVMRERILDINPTAQVECFPEGVSLENMDRFFSGVDLYVDSLDAFALEIRREVFLAAQKRGIPAITVAPIAMGAALLVFDEHSMSFDDYFGLHLAKDPIERMFRFLVGLSPSALQRTYLVAPEYFNLAQKKAASTPMGCALAAGVAGSEAVKLLLKRGHVYRAPWSVHFDAYRNRIARSWRPFGHRNPLQRLMLKLVMAKIPQNVTK